MSDEGSSNKRISKFYVLTHLTNQDLIQIEEDEVGGATRSVYNKNPS